MRQGRLIRRAAALGIATVLVAAVAPVSGTPLGTGPVLAAEPGLVATNSTHWRNAVSPGGSWRLVVAADLTTNTFSFYRSGSASWQQFSAPTSARPDVIGINDNGDAYVVLDVGSTMGIYTYDGAWSGPTLIGNAWDTTSVPGALVVTSTRLVAISAGDGGVYESIDGGDSWHSQGDLPNGFYDDGDSTALMYGNYLYVLSNPNGSTLYFQTFHLANEEFTAATHLDKLPGAYLVDVRMFEGPGGVYVTGRGGVGYGSDSSGGMYLWRLGITSGVAYSLPLLIDVALPAAFTAGASWSESRVSLGSDDRIHVANWVVVTEGQQELYETSFTFPVAENRTTWAPVTSQLAYAPAACPAGTSAKVASWAAEDAPRSAPMQYVVSACGTTYWLEGPVGGDVAEPQPTLVVASGAQLFTSSSLDPRVAVSPGGVWHAVSARITPSPGVRVWRSMDGVTWEDLGPFPYGTTEALAIGDNGDVWVPSNGEGYGFGTRSLFRYTDGRWMGHIDSQIDNGSHGYYTRLRALLTFPAGDGSDTEVWALGDEGAGATFTTTPGDYWQFVGGFGPDIQSGGALGVGSFVHAWGYPNTYARWDRSTRAWAPATTPPDWSPNYYSVQLLAKSGSLTEVWAVAAYYPPSGAPRFRVNRTLDAGDNWEIVNLPAPFPGEVNLGFPTFTIGGDNRIHAFTLRASGALAETSHALAAGGAWTPVRTIAQLPGGATLTTAQQSNSVKPYAIDVFAAVQTAPGEVTHYWIRRDPVAPAVVPTVQVYGAAGGEHTVMTTAVQSDPVNTAIGAYLEQATDASIAAVGVPFTLERTYTSLDTTDGPMGVGWTHNHLASIAEQPGGDVVFRTGDGAQLAYHREPDGVYTPAPGVRSTLARMPTGWEVTTQDQRRYTFDSAGRMTGRVDQNGQGLAYTYDAEGRMATATDAGGRTVSFAYDGDSLLRTMTLADGRTVQYGYTDRRLTSVTNPAGGVERYTYDAQGRLAEHFDENDHRVVFIEYGPDGRVVRQTDALGAVGTFAWDSGTQISTYTDARGNQWRDEYAANVLMAQSDPLGNVTRYEYDDQLNRARVIDPLGHATTMTYDFAGNMVSRADALGNTETSVYDARNHLTNHTDARGNATTYVYDVAGNLDRVTRPPSRTTDYTIDGRGLVTSVTDPIGRITRYEYDTAGNRTKVTTPRGSITTSTYDGGSRLTAMVSPRGNAAGGTPAEHRTEFAYDSLDRLAVATDPLGNVSEHSYDAVGNDVETVDALDRVTTNVYDAANQLVEVRHPDGAIERYEYDGRGNRTRAVDGLGRASNFTYDARNLVVAEADPLGNATSREYDGAGRVTRAVDPRGNATTFVYDDVDRLVTQTDALARTTMFAYDAVGNRTAVVDGRANQTQYTYDTGNRLTQVRAPDTATTTYGYDNADQVLTETDPLNRVTTYTYDADGNRLTVRLPSARTTTFTYDVAGSPATAQDPLDHVTTYGTDALSRPVSVTDAEGNVTRTVYDAFGNVAGRVDALNRSTAYEYDGRNRLVRVGAPDLTDTDYDYDLAGNLVGRRDGNAHATAYEYDLAHRLTAVVDPLARRTTFAYDAAGNRTRRTDPDSVATNFGYDEVNQLATIDYGDATADVAYTYDGVGNRASMTDAYGTVAYAYDSRNRLTQTARGADAFTYTYNADSTVAAYTVPGGAPTGYVYDTDGRVTGTCLATAACTTGVADRIGYSYDTAGRLTAASYPSGVSETRAYDNADRTTQVAYARSGTFARRTYTYDAVGNPTEVVDQGGASTAYAYDARDRVLRTCFAASSCSPGAADVAWTYDAVGNRAGETRSGTTSYMYDAADQLTNAGTESYTYDTRGNMTGAGDATYTYDRAGRTTGAEVPRDVTGEYASIVLADAPRAYWRLGETTGTTAADSSGNGVTATYRNTPTRGEPALVPGEPNGAVKLNGTNEFVKPKATRIDRRSFSVEAWIEPDSSPPAEQTIYAVHAANTAGKSFAVTVKSNGAVAVQYDANQVLTTAAGVISFGQASHVAVTYDNAADRTRIYVNGVERASGDQGPYVATGGTHAIGRHRSTAWKYFKGTIDDVAIYLSVLSPARVAAHASPTGTVTDTATFGYDGDGRRYVSTNTIARQPVLPSDTLTHIWDPRSGSLAVERGADGVVTARFSDGLTGDAATTGAGVRSYLYPDRLGSTIATTDAAGVVGWRGDYEPFGTVRSATGSPAPRLGFHGVFTEPASGLLHMGARDMDPTLGRFTATDPLAPPITDPFVSAYVYANDRPTVLVDPGGLRPGRPGGFRDWAGGFGDGVKAILPGLRDMAIDGFKCSIGGAVFTDPEEGLRACGRLVMGVPMMFKTAWDCGFNSSHGFLSGDKSQLRAAGGECAATAAVIAADVGIRAALKTGTNARTGTAPEPPAAATKRGSIGPEAPSPTGEARPNSLGSTGRPAAKHLNEQLAMEQAMSDPATGTRLPTTMSDARWPASDGWVKMSQNINGIEIHYVLNTVTGAVDDFKFIGGTG